MSIDAGGPSPEANLPATGSAVKDTAVSATPAANGVAVLTAVDLTLGFGQRTILSDINVGVRRGAVTALIGPTGSGKSTCCAPSTG